MSSRKGIKEKLHIPIYDAFFVSDSKEAAGKKFEDFMADTGMIRFFVDVQNKTRLETNLQAAGVLPSMGPFEAQAMRVVIWNVPVAIDRNAVIDAGDKYATASKTTKTATPRTSLSLQLRRHATAPGRLPLRLSTTQ